MNYSSFKQDSKRRLLLTKEGLDKLRGRLDEITTRRHKALRKLHHIDKNDTDELSLAVEIQKLESTEQEAAELADLLQHVEPITKQKIPKQVAVGWTVGLKRTDRSVVVRYTIVNPLELDIAKNKISEDSVLGRAAMGKKIGDSFSIVTPKGALASYQIVSIS